MRTTTRGVISLQQLQVNFSSEIGRASCRERV